MGVLSWLALVALVAYRIPTASATDDVIVHVVSLINDTDIDRKVTELAMEWAAIKTPSRSPQDGDCFESRLKEQKKIGLILITKPKECLDVGANTRRLLLSYDEDKHKFSADKSEWFNVTDLGKLGKHLEAFVKKLIVEGKPVQQQTEYGIRVPVFGIVFVGVLVGLLLALSCIFFSKYRASTSKTHPIEKPSCQSSKGGSSSKSACVKMQKKGSSCSSKSSSSSKSEANSSKGKKRERKESCRSSKSLATKTCDISGPSSVKVVSVPAPKQKQNNVSPPAFPLFKDEVATVMASSGAVQPVRDLERVRAPATVPKSCCGHTVPRPSVITTQPRPATKGPPIVPTVSVIGHAPSPFAVLAQATSPLPPASTPAIFSSAPTAYSNPTLTTVATAHSSAAPTVPTSSAPLTTVVPAPTVSASTVPVSSAPQTTVVPAPTVSQSSVTVPTTTSAPPTTVAPPPPVSLVSTVSLSSVVPVAVTPSPFPSHPLPVPSPSIHHSTIPISPAYSLASTPRSSSPSSNRSTREKAPFSKRSQKK